jgi:AcrR family transcriptional regulator
MGRPRSDIAPRLLRAARARFLHEGVDGASLREIARAAGTSLGMIHYYFATKDDLFLAVVEEVYGGFAADVAEVMRAPGTFEERVRALYGRIARASDDELDIIRLIVREVLVSSARRRLIMERFLRGHVPPVLAALAGAQAGGEVDPRHPLGAAGISMLALGIFPQLLRRLVGDGAPVPLPAPEELAAALATVLFEGIGRR